MCKTPKERSELDQWHRKIGHLSTEWFKQHSELNNDIPKFERNSLSTHQYVPCLVGKSKRAPIPRATCKTTAALEQIHLEISGAVEKSLEGYVYTVAILYDFTAKSDVKILKKKSELLNALIQ